MLFVFVCVWWCQIRLDYMSNIAVSYKRKELFTLRKNMVSPPVYGGVSVAHLLSFLCCVFCFVCIVLRPVSCVPNVASFSRLTILDWSFDFL